MDSTGKLVDVAVDFKTQRRRLTFEMDNVSDEEINRLYGLEKLDIKADRQKRRRSLSSNAYFHVLCGKIAEALTISKAHAKNEMITKYGQRMFTGKELACIKTNLTIEQVREMEEPHLKFLKFDEAYFYCIYRGSHTYNSQEMAKLIEGTVADAKELGIETLTPQELAKMNQMWKAQDG